MKMDRACRSSMISTLRVGEIVFNDEIGLRG